jgi:hypothetical protein
LSAPLLNITVVSETEWPVLYDRNDNQTYNRNYIQSHRVCQDISRNTYQWGFSFLILFIFTVILLFWSIGTFILWLKAVGAMTQRNTVNSTGEYKALLYLADAITQNLQTVSRDPNDLTEAEIRASIKGELNGGKIPYNNPAFHSDDYHLRADIAARFKALKVLITEAFRTYRTWHRSWTFWWTLLIILLAILLFTLALDNLWADLVLSFSLFGIISSLIINTSQKGRILMTLIFLSLGNFVGAMVFVGLSI